MSLIDPIAAPFKGFQLCFSDPEIRKFATRPWLIGAVSYLFSVAGAIKLHPYLMHHIAPAGSSFGEGVLSLFAWIGITFALLIGTVIVTILIVLICGVHFHAQIARHVLAKQGVQITEASALAEITRTTITETLKLLWIVPLFLITFLLGLFPPFAPFAFVLGSLLLSYQFFDYPLDWLKYGAFQRLGFLLAHLFAATLFGATLILLGSIPFVALFLPPVAVAGASWLFGRMNWIPRRALEGSR